eukprot:7133209-Prymnesium_polylepis.1
MEVRGMRRALAAWRKGAELAAACRFGVHGCSEGKGRGQQLVVQATCRPEPTLALATRRAGARGIAKHAIAPDTPRRGQRDLGADERGPRRRGGTDARRTEEGSRPVGARCGVGESGDQVER